MTYEPERIAFAQKLVATTDRVFTIVTNQSSIARFIRTRLVPLLAPSLFQVAALRHFLFQTVSQIGVHYHDSSLSEGQAGKIRGGDRLPWVRLNSGEDNFAPLSSLRWQVHVYGKHNQELSKACNEMNLPLHTFPWEQKMKRSGFCQDAFYLVRPDGYVALAEPHADSEKLRHYFRRYYGRT